MTRLSNLHRHPRWMVALVLVGIAGATGVVFALTRITALPTGTAQPTPSATADVTSSASTQSTTAPGAAVGADPAAYQLQRLRALKPVATGTVRAPITGEAAQQPDLYALFSVTDADDAAPPIPTATDWEALGLEHGYTTVTVDRVEEPLAWTNAVASGRITDPGITGREVAATVVRHTTVDGQPRNTTFSVAISLNLEGPPTRATWGFVAAPSYTSIQAN